MINYILHARNREYMSGVERDKLRIKQTAEIFTPTILVQEMLDNLEDKNSTIFSDPTKTYLDNSCGDGQFLGEVLICKMENGVSFEQALESIYGVDIMQDNVDLCRDRLLCGQEHLRHIVEKNIQCRDAIKFGYNFKSMGPARRKTEEKYRLRQEKRDKLEALKKKKESHQKKLFGAVLG